MSIDLGTVTDAYGKSKVVELTTANTTVLTNAANSGEVFQLHSIVVSNFSTNVSSVSMILNKSGNLLTLSDSVRLPANTNLSLIDKTLGIYLEANDSVIARSVANSTVVLTTSYNTLYSEPASACRVLTFTANRATANSNAVIAYTITTANIANGTSIFYRQIGSANSSAFLNNVNSGTFTVSNNASSFNLTIRPGTYTGAETVILQARISSDNGYPLANSSVVSLTA